MKYLNVLLVFGIIASGVFYFYFKTKQFRTSQVYPIRKKMYASMAGASLGSLLFFYGLNHILLFDGVISYTVAGIFIVFGSYVFLFNRRATKHYKQYVDEEKQLNEAL